MFTSIIGTQITLESFLICTAVSLVLGVGTFGYVLVSGILRIAAGPFAWIDGLSLVFALVLLALGFLLMGRVMPVLFGKQQPETEEE